MLGLFSLSYKVKTKTPTVYGTVFNVRALTETHRILKFNLYDSFQIDVHIHIIILNILKIDPAVFLNKTCTNYYMYIQNTFATISYTQLKED